MINEIFFMNGYGLYVWSAFTFTLVSFAALYTLIKIDLANEESKFLAKFVLLDKTKIRVAKTQSTNREILANSVNSKI